MVIKGKSGGTSNLELGLHCKAKSLKYQFISDHRYFTHRHLSDCKDSAKQSYGNIF